MRRHYGVEALVLAAILAIPGCALREYESRIDAQRERMKIIDEENDLLADGPIDMPTIAPANKNDTPIAAWPFEVFLRLPRAMGTAPAATAYVSPAQDLRLIRYGASDPDYNMLIAAALTAEGPAKDGKSRAGEFAPGVFLDRVRGALLDYYRKEYKVTPVEIPLFDLAAKGKNGQPLFKKFTKQPRNERGEALPPIDYEAVAFRDDRSRPKEPSVFQLYYHRRDTKQVAIVVQFPASRLGDAQTTRALDLSLSTLELVPSAIGMRRSALASRRR